MRISELHAVFIQEIFGHCAFNGLSVLQLKGETLHLCRLTSHITHAIFSTHCSAMCDLDLQALDLFGEFDSLRVGQRFTLLSNVTDIQHFTHEINDRLGFVKRSCGNVDIEHHFPLGGPNALMEAKPDLASTTQGMVVTIGAGEKASAYRCVGHGGQVSHDYIQCLNSIKRNGSSTTCKEYILEFKTLKVCCCLLFEKLFASMQ